MNKRINLTILTLAFLIASVFSIYLGSAAAAGFFGVFCFVCMWEILSD